ncbi:MAG: ABC transporter permease, partial [Candidatus Micrarchaeota archaeon]|nr:ABC transporter permease [Candidatus Micrarchaeota archaeon]
MVQFLTVLAKELTLFWRRKSTTALVLISPLFIILFLGLLFGGGQGGVRSLPVAVCNHDAGVVGAAYVNALQSYELLKVTDYGGAYARQSDCRQFLETN